VEFVMSAVEELEEVLFPRTRGLADFDPTASSTQQLLDELLGCFEDDDSTTLLARSLTPEFCGDSDE
jgi:hypothetical protein